MSRLKSWMKHELVRKTTRNSGILLSGNMGTAVFGVISTTIMARALGADLLGRLLFVQWYGVIIDKILNFQSWHVVIKFGAEQQAKPGHGEFGSVLKTGFLIDITTAILGAITAILMIPLAARWLEWDYEMTNAAYLFGAAILFHVSGTPVGILRILRKFGIYIRQTMLGSALKSVLVLFVWLNDGSFIHYAIALVAAESLRHLLLFASAIRVAHGSGYRVFSAPWFSDWKSFLGFAVWTNLKASILLPVQEFDKLIVARLVSYEGLAVYRVFGQLTQFASKVSTPVNQAVYPEIADLVSEGKGRDAAKLAGKIGILLGAALGIPSIVVTFTSAWWLDWIYGAAFSAQWIVFGVMLMGRVGLVSLVAVEPLFISNGLVKESFWIALAGALIYLPMAYFLVNSFGIIGIAAMNIAFSAGVALPKIAMLRRRGLLRNQPVL